MKPVCQDKIDDIFTVNGHKFLLKKERGLPSG
jgi:hypothetical protein